MKSDPHAPTTRTAVFRFYAELNDFLPVARHKRSFPYEFIGKPTVKGVIEAIGVPHAEIDLVLVDGESVGFDHQLLGGERVSVYPVFESFDITPLIHLREKPLRDTKFIVDVNLGKLAKKLRLLGFDSLYRNNFEDSEIVKIALLERRIILTRDKGVLKHRAVTHGYWVRSNDPGAQMKEVVSRFQLESSFRPFIRCTNCNGILQQVEKVKVQDRLPADTLQYCDVFWQCESCQKLYWRGSHYQRICDWVSELKG